MTPSLYGTMKDDISYMYSQSLLNLKALDEWPVHPFKIGYFGQNHPEEKKRRREGRIAGSGDQTQMQDLRKERRRRNGWPKKHHHDSDLFLAWHHERWCLIQPFLIQKLWKNNLHVHPFRIRYFWKIRREGRSPAPVTKHRCTCKTSKAPKREKD